MSKREEALEAIHRPREDKPQEAPGFVIPEEDTEEIGYGEGCVKNEKGKLVNVLVPTQIEDSDSRQTQLIDNPKCLAKRRIIKGFVPANKRAVTKHEDKDKQVALYIRMGTSGFLFNPWGLYSEGQNNQFARHAGRPTWQYRRVSEKCFAYYLEFLRTRNKAHLLNAEREVRNV